MHDLGGMQLHDPRRAAEVARSNGSRLAAEVAPPTGQRLVPTNCQGAVAVRLVCWLTRPLHRPTAAAVWNRMTGQGPVAATWVNS